jgi:hypothetical protein
MKLTGAKGVEIGRIKDATTEWILNDKPDATEQEIADYIKKIA